MTVTLELSPEEAAALSACAQADGVDIETVLHRLVAHAALPPPPCAPEQPAPAAKTQALAALMRAGRREEQTDDPEALAAQDQELRESQANIARWHAEQRQR